MKHIKSKLSVLLLLGLGLTDLQAQNLYVNESNGSQTAYTLSNVRKMTFSGGNIHIQENDNSIATFALSEIKYLSVYDYVTDIEEQKKNTFLTAYPNPVNDILNIDLSNIIEDEPYTIHVFSIDGNKVLTHQTQGGGTAIINLSTLTKGIYFCQFDNGSEIKTLKIIKN